MIDNGYVDLNETTDRGSKDHSLIINIGCHNTLNGVVILA